MDEPHDEIERLLTADGPEGDVIRREYEITAGENGLHPDDDFEEILDSWCCRTSYSSRTDFTSYWMVV